ncbi:flagellar hook-basal body complex protein FliE [Sphingomonas phyllosphaerae]|uniref:flagellar hook-basal body complex protein FliE n=1 Tax=Sphingomonas phyllosphaerae TaxID=257003 RepID=UPI0009DB7BC8|nr:flagellar hook-basal body complex protein FliE [Sphingomonas phyllosphaerae]
MMAPVGAIEGVLATPPVLTMLGAPPPVAAPGGPGFADLLAAGMRGVESKVAAADDLVRRFTLEDGVPVHQVTFALAEARLSVELAMQVRGRLLDGYRELMTMQL